MKILRDTVHSYLLDATEEELSSLIKMMTFVSNRESDKCLINDDGEFYTGIIPVLQSKGFDLEIIDDSPTPMMSLKDINVYEGILDGMVLRKYQCMVVRKCLAQGRGVIQSPTGCFSGSTKVSLLDGTERTLRSLHEEGGEYWFYSYDPSTNLVVPGGPSKVVKTLTDTKMLKVTLDNGKYEVCTPDHLWLTKSGKYVPAKLLKPGDSLAPLYRRIKDGYEQVRLVSVEPWHELEDAYDVANCAPMNNFALSSGVFVHNSGKTEMAASVIQHLKLEGIAETFLCLTPSVFLMQQMVNRFKKVGIQDVCGVGGGTKFRKSAKVAVFVVQSAMNALDKDDDAGFFVRYADALLLDEAHHAKARTWTTVGEQCEAKLRFSFTATAHEDPRAWSYDDLVLIGLTGPIIFNIRSKELRERKYLADPLVTVIKVPRRKTIPTYSWPAVYKKGIVNNKERNSMIVSLASTVYNYGHKAMIFVGQKTHGHHLGEKLSKDGGCETVFVHGGGRSYVYRPSGTMTSYKWKVDDIANYVNSRDRCILVSTCLAGSTRVPLMDGTEHQIKDLVGRDPFFVYSVDNDTGSIVPGIAHSVRSTGFRKTLEVKLDNGCTERLTPDHLWLLSDGKTYVRTDELKPGTSLAPLYRSKNKRGYETYLDSNSGEFKLTHQMSAKWWYGPNVYKYTTGRTVIHHQDFNKLNNEPTNLIPMTSYDHIKLHGDNLRVMRSSPEFEGARLAGSRRYCRSLEGREAFSTRMKRSWRDPDFVYKMYNRPVTLSQSLAGAQNLRDYNLRTSRENEDNGRYRHEVTLDNVLKLMEDPYMTISEACKFLRCSRKVINNRLQRGLSMGWLATMRLIHGDNYYNNGMPTNHKVVSVREGPTEEVFDLTVDGTHNFALSSGVFVHNCVLDEGLDVPVINVLFMATGMEKYRRTIQRIGRGMRPKSGSNKVFVFDFMDETHPYLSKHSKYRLWTYAQEEYDISTSMDHTMEMMGCEATFQDIQLYNPQE